MILTMELGADSYPIIIERSALKKAADHLNLHRRVLILTDDGVPKEYAETLASQCAEPHILTLPQGEETKCMASFEKVLGEMLSKGFTRKDCVAAVGGGVVGDLAGFAASAYMRGIDFYNIPTTLLSQVDSSVGGKTGINLNGIKNIVGAFYQPKAVIIDPDVLNTLSPRQLSTGMAEAAKMALTSDEELFELFENSDPFDRLDEIIPRAIAIKKAVVEQDEKEQGLRRILNFGHTLAHGIESLNPDIDLYHGECVALGMLPMCSEEVRERLIPVLKKLNLPTSCSFDREAAFEALLHDKKSVSGGVNAVLVNQAGSFEIKKLSPDQLKAKVYSIPEEDA